MQIQFVKRQWAMQCAAMMVFCSSISVHGQLPLGLPQSDVAAVKHLVSNVPGSLDANLPTKLAVLPARSPAAATGIDIATPELVVWLERLIRNNLPETYENDRHWNQQKEVWDGIKLRRDGWRIETKRKKKLVNSGTWTRYSISLAEPEKTLFVQLQRLEQLPDGSVAFAISVDCALDVFGRLSQWVRDVQLISISANADAACRLDLQGTVRFQMNPLKLPPDVSLKPQVDTAHVSLTYYRVRRISQVGGDVAKVLGKGLRAAIDEKLQDMNSKLVDKINGQLEKHADKLSFSAQDWLRSKLRIAETNVR